MRNISFALTTKQFYLRQKTVTRRLGWLGLRAGDLLCGVLKGMGLGKGVSPTPLAVIRVTGVRREFLREVTQADVVAEGFPHLTPRDFVRLFCDSHESCKPSSVVTRIEFRFVPGGRFVAKGFCRVCQFAGADDLADDLSLRTADWADERGLISAEPTTLCVQCSMIERFA
jgi:hypothetical protein